METLLKHFYFAHIRNYKGGKEIRVQELEPALEHAEYLIKHHNLSLEITDRNPILKSFVVTEKK